MNLDNVSKLFLDSLKIDTPLYEMSPDDARSFLNEVQNKYYKHIDAFVEDVEIFDEKTGNISVTLVHPEKHKDEKLPVIIYCHGGGWVIGDFNSYEMTVKTIANHTKSVVAFVNYPRSPEFKYPHALNHIYGALTFFAENGDKYNIDSKRIAIAGDSAGANMAGVIAIRSKKENGPKICFQVLIYPVCDADMKTDSYKEFKNGPWLSKKAMEWFWQCYISDKNERKEIYASLLNANITDLRDLPPALIITAENDVLRDEGEEYARKLIEAGVDTACVRINNTFHDFIMLNALRDSKAVKAAYKLLCKFLKYELHKSE